VKGYTIPTSYCSKSCAGKAKGPILEDRGKENLKAEALQCIEAAGRYLTKEEILTEVKCSSKTLTKHGIKISELNAELGFIKPRSVFEGKVGRILKDKFSNVESEKTFEGLTAPTGYPLRVDFYIPELNLVVEADGLQHSDKKHPWATHPNGTVREYDEIKNKFLRDNEIDLVRIPYSKNVTPESVLDKLDI
jgi:hypothetical protein